MVADGRRPERYEPLIISVDAGARLARSPLGRQPQRPLRGDAHVVAPALPVLRRAACRRPARGHDFGARGHTAGNVRPGLPLWNATAFAATAGALGPGAAAAVRAEESARSPRWRPHRAHAGCPGGARDPSD